MQERENFGQFGALMVMAGSAIGLGNLWRFPFLLGENGGCAFLIVYIICSFLIALPIFFSEFIVGRRSRKNCYGAFKAIAGQDSAWRHAGLIAFITPIVILSFYSVVGGWSVEYLFKACTFDFSHDSSQQQISGIFSSFVSSVWAPLLGHTIFLLTSAFIVSKGVKKGIENFGKISMPILFFIVFAIAIYMIFVPGSEIGYKYLFRPDFSKITPQVVSAALGQAFFSLSLGCGCIMTYASYVKKKDSLVRHCFCTTTLDILFAILASCAIMPAVFAFGIDPVSGPPLVYETLPFIFSKMVAGNVIAIVFFIALLVAALTSEVSMFEAAVSLFVEEKHLSRHKAVMVVAAIGWILGCLCSLSFGPLSEFRIFGLRIFDFLDRTTSNYLMTIGALLTVIFVGWKMNRSDVRDEFLDNGKRKKNFRYFPFVYFLIKYLSPAAIILIFISGILL